MLDDKVARVRDLIAKRDEIDAELAQLLGVEVKKRGRPRKPDTNSTETAE